MELARIFLPAGILNLTSPFNYVKLTKLASNMSKQNVKDEVDYLIILPQSCYTSVTNLVKNINDSIKKNPVRLKLTNGKISIVVISRRSSVITKITIHHKLACMLGFNKSDIDFDRFRKEVVIGMFLPINSVGRKVSSKYKFSLFPDLEHTIPPYIFVYCSMVRKTVVSGIPIPLLKIIPRLSSALTRRKGELYQCENLEYFPIQYNYIQIIEFKLRSHDGELVMFEGGTC